MAYTPTRFCQSVLTTSNSTLYTVPASKTAIVKQIFVSNIGSATQTFGIVMAGNTVCNNISLNPNSITTIDLVQVLNTGETIVASSNANSAINVMISGVVIG